MYPQAKCYHHFVSSLKTHSLNSLQKLEAFKIYKLVPRKKEKKTGTNIIIYLLFYTEQLLSNSVFF